jgi:tetratricopeptide (TPR) repeat protein
VIPGSPEADRLTGDPRDLLPLALSRPSDALARARSVLAARPGPYAASVAHQAIGIVLRDFGDTAAALGELRQAVRLAVRSGAPDREADVLATLGLALVDTGRTASGLAALDRAAGLAQGVTAARVLFRRGHALNVLGRHREALGDLRQAIPVLTKAKDVLWSARAYTARGLANLALGAPDRAELDFQAAERLYGATDQEVESVFALHNRGLTAARLGDLPSALKRFDEAGRRYEELGLPMPELGLDRCAVFLAAGLARDAVEEADAALRLVERIGGQAAMRAQLLLTAARAALAAGEPHTAIDRATAAARVFARQRREWWRVHARLVLLHARFAAGMVSGRLVAEAARVAGRLTALHSPDSAQAWLLAGRTALALGREAEGDRHLAVAARGRGRGPVMYRVDGWLAEALRAEAAGDVRRTLHACRRGLAVLDEHRLTLGASELRAHAAARGAELAALAQRTCLLYRDTRELLAWSERWRATALAVPLVRPPDDPELQGDLTAFREISSKLEGPDPQAPALQREQRRLELQIRRRTLRTPGATAHTLGEPGSPSFDPRELLRELGGRDGTVLVEIVSIGGHLHVLVCTAGRVHRFPAGRMADAAAEVEYARGGLRRLAYAGTAPGAAPAQRAAGGLLQEPSQTLPDVPPTGGGGGGMGRRGPVGRHLPALEASARRLQELLLGEAVAHLGDGPLVLVPPGTLHGVPWTMLPALRDREVAVSPSASAWLRARTATAAERRDVVLVRGPGLKTGGAEVLPLASAYPEAAVLQDGTATSARVLRGIDGAWLAHIAAHGTFRADSPLFSSLRMDDGPLTVHDFERLRRAPYRLILPSCDSGRLASVGADELLGLSAALLPLGTAGIVASIVPVNDEAVVPLMVAFHRGLRGGASMARALRDARQAMPPDPVHLATAWSFIAVGAG